VAAPFAFEHRAEFLPESSDELLRSIPAAPGVFALRGADPAAEPYLTRAADLRRRLRRLLDPPEALDENGQPLPSKRLNLRARIAWIEWTRTGSDFESTLLLYRASRAAFGPDEARRRLRLHAPYVLRITMSQPHPRVYSTNRLSKKFLAESFGPFPSRAAAERYADAVLDLFLLRRCYEDLAPYPEHPGCVYGEMNKCMQPCKEGNPQACTPEQYAQEAERVFAFFTTCGQSLLDEVAAKREAASEAMDFELAATLHKQWEKVRAAALLADELVRPLDELRALILQEAALLSEDDPRPEAAALFLFEHGQLCGPERLSTLGVRAVREQTAVGSSLFAQPLMLAPIPLDEPATPPSVPSSEQNNSVILSEGPERAARVEGPQSKDPEGTSPTQTAPSLSTLTPEDRARAAIDALAMHTESFPDMAEFCDHLSLFRRWYYRPEKQRTGEVFLPNPDGLWPIRRLLNGAARVALGPPAPLAPADRAAAKEGAKALKTKIIHAGREGVEREVPILPKRPRTRKAVPATDLQASAPPEKSNDLE
jgi:excinuclease ABC subunit C